MVDGLAGGWPLLLTSLAFGFRHGIDWDHLAAIADITSSQESPRRGFWFGTLYAAGHALVVLAIGVVAVVLGDTLPDSVDTMMSRVVGVTLLALGIYVFYSLAKHGRNFRMRSRWMLLFSAVKRSYIWLRIRFNRSRQEMLEHRHVHSADLHHDLHAEDAATNMPGNGPATHEHTHRHPMPADPFIEYGAGTSITVGALHGIGAETPTQVVIFVAAAGAGGVTEGLVILFVFLAGLFAANTLTTLGAAFGFFAASKNFAFYAGVSVVAAAASLIIGALFITGNESVLPIFFGGGL